MKIEKFLCELWLIYYIILEEISFNKFDRA